jgi:CheY-like chemotaxis protein
MSGPQRDPVHVLIVDDDPGDALMLRESFGQVGRDSRFHLVPDGQRALQFLRRAGEYADAPRPGLVLLDLNLPGLHGLDVLAQIKADPDLMIIPVIVVSSSQDPADITDSYTLHANAYIVKPHDLDGYAVMIKQVDACFLGLIQPPPAPEPGR